MKIIMRTDSTNAEYYAECECAVIDVTPELLSRIAARVEILRQAAEVDRNIYKLVFRGSGPDFYSYKLIDACAEAGGIAPLDWEDQFQDEGVMPVPSGVDLERFEPQRTECDQEIIRVHRADGRLEFEVAWMVIPKHSDIYIATEVLTVDRLQSFAVSEPAAQVATADRVEPGISLQ